MSATAAFDQALPGESPFEQFQNGERVVKPLADGPTDAFGSFWLARRIRLNPGRYTVKFFCDDAASLRVGSDFTASRVIFAPRFDDGIVYGEFYVMEGETRFDVLLHNLTDTPSPCYFVMSIFRDGLCVYASAADGWMCDSDPISEADLAGDPADDETDLPVFTILPNWRDGITERMTYLTDVIGPTTVGEEQRRSLRAHPRRSFEAGFLRSGVNRQRLDNFLAGIGRKPFMFPLWHEQLKLTADLEVGDTQIQLPADFMDREFRADSYAIIMGKSPDLYEVVAITGWDTATGVMTFTAVTKNWIVGSRVMPLRRGRFMDSTEHDPVTAGVTTAQLRFEMADADSALSAPWGAADPSDDLVFNFKPNWAQNLSFTFARDDYALDNGAGRPQITDPSDQARITQKLNLGLFNRTAVYAYRRFVASARGRAVRFYAPTFTSDLTLAGDISGGAFIDCQNAGFSRLMKTAQQCRDLIRIHFNDGSPSVSARLLYAEELSNGIERFHLAAEDALVAIDKSTVSRIEWLVSSRFDQDAFEIQHYVDDSRAVTAACVIRSVDGAGMTEVS